MGRHYKKRQYKTDYQKEDFQPCWTCKNCYGGCNWSKNYKPVNGWIATPTKINNYDVITDSYKIIYCPEYTPEERKEK